MRYMFFVVDDQHDGRPVDHEVIARFARMTGFADAQSYSASRKFAEGINSRRPSGASFDDMVVRYKPNSHRSRFMLAVWYLRSQERNAMTSHMARDVIREAGLPVSSNIGRDRDESAEMRWIRPLKIGSDEFELTDEGIKACESGLAFKTQRGKKLKLAKRRRTI